jgi:hypothetical protein
MRVAGTIRAPGDKSITHRALLLAALGGGASHVGGALTSLDARSSARVLRQLGAEISPLREGEVLTIRGRRRFRPPERPLDCGNSGTTTRLLLGLLAGHRFRARLTGDASLRRRPMRRVTVPLTEMGARFEEHGGDGLPLTVQGGKLRAIRYAMPVSSAQIKSYAALVARAARNADRNGVTNARFYAANLTLPSADAAWARQAWDLVLLDPPRAGAREILPVATASRPRRIVYVSCHPGTLARDAGILVGQYGYRLKTAGIMDMFPHTSHVEAIALFEPAAGPAAPGGVAGP